MFVNLEDTIAISGTSSGPACWRVHGLEDYEQVSERRYMLGERVEPHDVPGYVSNFIILGAMSDETFDFVAGRLFDSVMFVGSEITDRLVTLFGNGEVRSVDFELCDLSKVSDSFRLRASNARFSSCAGPRPEPGQSAAQS